MKTKWSIQKLIYTGMLAAVAGALMSLEFSVPMMPPFYKIDFSDVPSIIALFLLGPASAAWVEIIKIIIKLITVGTNSMYVGEFANLIGVVLFVIPMWAVYKKRRKDPPGSNRVIGSQRPHQDLVCLFLQCIYHPSPVCSGHGAPSEPGDYHGGRGKSGHQRSDHLHLYGHHPLQPD